MDADEGSNGKVTYGFMHKDSTVPAFSIHPDTGTETLKNVLLYLIGILYKEHFFFLKGRDEKGRKKSTVGYINTNISSQKKKLEMQPHISFLVFSQSFISKKKPKN